MQSSVRSLTPRMVNIGRQEPNSAIQINQEVSVVSSRRDGFRENGQRATYSIIPSTNVHTRQSSRGAIATVTASQPNWNSESRTSTTSRASSLKRPQHTLRSQESRDEILLECNRESMKALSDFLRTKEPPLDNFMSIPESDRLSLYSSKKSAFKMFKRRKSQSSKRSRLLQLPDSAVSARTMDGSRHIAISIPIEHDHLFYQPPSQCATQIRPRSQPSKLPSERSAVVTVLKPVKEVRESTSSSRPIDTDGKRDGSLSATTPAAELLGPETTSTLRNYYSQLNSEQQKEKRPASSASGVKAGESSRPQKAYVAVSPLDGNSRESQRNDPRHSGGTVYSTTSATTYQGHSRGVSSVSTAPSIITMKLELPPRTSSMSKIPKQLEAELAQTFATVNNVLTSPEQSGRTRSLTSGKSQSSPAPYTAEAANYNFVGIEHIRGPAPTRRLPDVPESPLVPSFMPRPSPTPSWERSPPATLTPTESQMRHSKPRDAEPLHSIPQSRQDRVKARKARDIAALREKSPHPQPLSDLSCEPAISNRPSTAPPNMKRKSISHEKLRRRRQNTVSAIMLVADLPPFTGVVLHSDLAHHASRKNIPATQGIRSSASNANMSTKGTHTPPRSFVSSNLSDSETIPKDDASIGPGSLRSVRSGLDSRRQERRLKRNMSLREKDMDSRMRKIEKDNAMLLDTLGGIANSFAELSKILPRDQQRRGGGLLASNDMEGVEMEKSAWPQPQRKMRSLEPVMRELQGMAGRLSGEESVRGFDDFEENDWSSIL